MNSDTVKTTVEISRELLLEAKMQALREQKTLKEFIRESLTKRLHRPVQPDKTATLTIGGYHLGGVKTSLRRREIYDHL